MGRQHQHEFGARDGAAQLKPKPKLKLKLETTRRHGHGRLSYMSIAMTCSGKWTQRVARDAANERIEISSFFSIKCATSFVPQLEAPRRLLAPRVTDKLIAFN